jgi:Protein of unknown function (DUF4199)
MSNVVKSGILLGVLVEVWTVVVILAHWHTDPVLAMLFFLVIPIQIAVVVMALRGEAANASYGRQVVNGTVLSAIGAVIIFAGSWLLTTVAFPNYFPELRAAGEAFLVKAGKTQDQVAAEMAKNAAMYDPFQNALTGAIATVATGLVVSLVAGAFLRRKA